MMPIAPLQLLVGMSHECMGLSLTWVLGQTGRSPSFGDLTDEQIFDLLKGAGFLVGAIVLLLVVLYVIRKMLKHRENASAGSTFSMGDLRQMRDDGLMTPQEFDRAKMLVAARSEMDEDLTTKLRKRAKAKRQNLLDESEGSEPQLEPDDGENPDDELKKDEE